MTLNSRFPVGLVAFALFAAVPVRAIEIYVESATAGKERFRRGTLERYADDELEFHLDGGGKLTLRQGNIQRIAFGVKPEWWPKGRKKNGKMKKSAVTKTPAKAEAKRPSHPKRIDSRPPKGKNKEPRSGLLPDRARRGEISRRLEDFTRRVREHLDAHPDKKRDFERLGRALVKQSDPKLADLLLHQLAGKLQSIPMGRGRKLPAPVVSFWLRSEVLPKMVHSKAKEVVEAYIRDHAFFKRPGPGPGRKRAYPRKRPRDK